MESGWSNIKKDSHVTGGCALLCMAADGRKTVVRKAKLGRLSTEK